MTAPASGRNTSRHLIAAGLVTAGIGLLYADVLAGLVRQWSTDDNYSHGFFVLPLALYFAWERRDGLAQAAARPSLAGIVIVALSLLVLLAGRLSAELFLTRASLVGLLAGVVLFVWGREHFRLLLFPLSFLLLMIPLPAILFNQLAFPLQLAASRAGEAAIAMAGIPVLREGNVLRLPAQTLEVVEACSGLRSLVSLIMLGVVLGYFMDRRVWARLAVAVAAIPIAIAANATRVAGTGIASEWLSPAAADGFFHTFSGWLVFVVAFGGLLLVQQVVGRIGRSRNQVQSLSVEPA